MNLILSPSILSADFGKLAEDVAALDAADCDWIHLDVMDGRFVPPITFGPQTVAAIRGVTKKPFDCHLMIEKPENQIGPFHDAGVDRLIIHQETCPHLHRVLESIKQANLLAGVAINPSTPADTIAEVLDLVDLILVMTVNPGWGGQKFLKKPLEKVSQIRQFAPMHHIEVDGGIDPTTIVQAAAAGANAFVAGNYTFSGDTPATRLSQLRTALCDASKS